MPVPQKACSWFHLARMVSRSSLNTVGRESAAPRLAMLLAEAAAAAPGAAAPANDGAALVPKPVENSELPPNGVLWVVVVLAPNPPKEKPVPADVEGAPNEKVGAVVGALKVLPKLNAGAVDVVCAPNPPKPVPAAAG